MYSVLCHLTHKCWNSHSFLVYCCLLSIYSVLCTECEVDISVKRAEEEDGVQERRGKELIIFVL